MPVDFVPFNVLFLNDIFKKLNLKTNDIFKYINYNFCTYIFTRGINKGLMCCRYSKNPVIDNCCSQHIKYFNNNNNDKIKKNNIIKNDNKYYKKKEIKYYCGSKGIKRDNCRRIVSKIGEKCIYHKNNDIDFDNKDIKITYKKNNLEDLRNINCCKILTYLGYDGINEGTYKRYRFEGHNIVISDNNKFYDNKTRISGFGSIDLLTKILKYNFKQCIEFLETIKDNKKKEKIFINIDKKENKENINIINKNSKKEYRKIPIYDLNNINNVKNYLINKRKIDKNIIEDLINKKLIYSDKYSNCIFIDNTKQYAYIRGTNDIKFAITNGKPSFFKYKFGDSKDVYLFESIIDALSFRTLYNKDGNYIVTNGNTLIKRINELEEINLTNIIYCCFDNDSQGIYFDLIIKNTYKNKTIKILKSNKKDYNEDLIESKF